MDRRQLLMAGALAPLSIAAADAPTSTRMRATKTRPAYRMKLGCQSMPSNDEHFAFFARYGVTNISAKPTLPSGRVFPTVDDLAKLRAMAERHGLSLDMLELDFLASTHIDREKNPAIMLADDPQRARDIESFNQVLRDAAKIGIPCVKYNMSLLGVLRTGTVQGRGDAHYAAWDLSKTKPAKPLTRAGVVDADRFWDRITYFLDRVVPVANETKTRIACHPQDPGVPSSGYQGIDRVLGTIDGLKRFVQINESPYHGLNFCQGTVSEDLRHPGTEIYDVIRWFGSRKKIFNVHFRNIAGGRDRFNETFPDDGDVDMVRALATYAEVGYEGMIMPDHVPGMDDPTEVDGKRVYTQRAENFAFCYGYIRGLIQSGQRLG